MPARRAVQNDGSKKPAPAYWSMTSTFGLIRRTGEKSCTMLGTVERCSFVLQHVINDEPVMPNAFVFNLKEKGDLMLPMADYRGYQEWNNKHEISPGFESVVTLKPLKKIPKKLASKKFFFSNYEYRGLRDWTYRRIFNAPSYVP